MNDQPGHVTRIQGISAIPTLPRPNDPRETSIVKRGEAIAHVRQLEDLVEHQKTTISKTLADLRSTENQRDLLDEERRKWRSDAEMYRTILVELAVEMRAINHHTKLANDVHQKVMNLLAREETEAPRQPTLKTATEVLNDLARNKEI